MSSKLRSIRAGHRSVVSKLFRKYEDVKQKETSEIDKTVLTNILDNLKRKQQLLQKLDQDIIDQLEDGDIETEIIETDEYAFELEIKITQISQLLQVQNSHLNIHADVFESTASNSSHPSYTVHAPNTDSNFNSNFQLPHARSSFSNAEYNKLPKLHLPTFDGDILQWQSFWDSYETAVHVNPTLSNVQRFNYLKSLLRDEALQTITGFSLTNTNYENAISLLHERYGQVHKITQTYMQALLDIQMPRNTLPSLRNYYDMIETYIRGLESLGQTENSYGSLLVPIILNKLPGEMRKNLTREHGSTNWRLHDLRRGIFHELNIMEAGNVTESHESPPATAAFLTNSKSRPKPMYNSDSNNNLTSSKTFTKSCIFCQEQHSSINCTKVTDQATRMSIVKKNRLCFNCLGRHKLSECKSKKNCQKCHKRHHTSLCQGIDNKKSQSNVNAHTVQEINQHNAEEVESDIVLQSQIPSKILLKTAVAPVSTSTSCIDANILFDEGAQRSFITETLAQKLSLTPTGMESVNLSGFGDTIDTRKVRHLKTSTIHVMTDDGKLPINVLIVPEIAVPIKTYVHKAANLKHLTELKLAHPPDTDDNFEVMVLIGADHYWSFVEDKVIRGNGPTAVKSKVGYLLSGPLYKTCNTQYQNCRNESTSMLNIFFSRNTEVCDLERFWKLESLGIESTESKNESEDFQEKYENSSIIYSDNRYYAKLPWKEDHPHLSNNKKIAQSRTENVIKRLSRNPVILQKYGEIIDEQERRGFIEEVNTDTEENKNVHYIPHHPVKKDSSTTPIRIVYDCSCKTYPDNVSLNDCLMNISPNLNDLTGILLRFRLHEFAVATDIEKAFLNIGLHTTDRDYTRFFWLSNPADQTSPLKTYRFKSVLFGATCSPFILNAVLNKHLKENQCDYTETLQKDLYVDNIVSSFSSEDKLLKYFDISRKLFGNAGFNLRSWASNNKALQDKAASENVLDDDNLVKILGLRWNTENDTLTFAKQENLTIPDTLMTKREILRQSSKIYDPLGIISPVTVRGKMLMQTLWESKFDWDETLPSDIITQWRKIREDINEMTKTEIPRSYFSQANSDEELTLHIFTDASFKAYGACAYLVCGNQSSLVMSRNRVTPLKQLTIPKLELMAAVIGSRLLNHIRSNLTFSKAVLWSDSQIVLNWISSSNSLPVFVRNRVNEIKLNTENFSWRYCPTNENPADFISRGISADKLKEVSKLWMKGPIWISDEQNWPQWTICDSKILVNSACEIQTMEVSNHSTNEITGIGNIMDISRFNGYQKLLRVTAFVLRFVQNCRKQSKYSGTLTVSEIQAASKHWIQHTQTEHYEYVFDFIKSASSEKTPSIVKQLKLFKDENNVLRCGGRIHNAPVSESAKFPVLLPTNSELTNLIIMDAHEKLFHSGLQSTVTFIRQSFWIPSIRQRVKTILHKCVKCKKVIGKPYSAPVPPPLPADRLTDSSPFAVTGVDFTGALTIRMKNGENTKAYICLFTCASTRAVHLEIVTDLTVDSFMLAFRRFVSRKSLPKVMISDNATTYVAAAKEIEQLTTSASLIDQLNMIGTTWKFIPKRAPWYGGFYERLIGLTKNCLKKVLGRAFVSLEILETVITEVESILNDRPLTYLSSDPIDEDPLTPSHLLYGRRIRTLPYTGTANVTDTTRIQDLTHNSANKLKRIQTQIIQHFWKRWKTEYLTALREYQRNNGKETQNIKCGEIVQIHNETSRTNWTLAVVEKLIFGNDGFARSAIVRTKTGLTSRPITKLYPLEIMSNSQPDTSCDLLNNRKSKIDAKQKIKDWTLHNR